MAGRDSTSAVVEGAAFAVGAGRRLDYRVVLAPAELIHDGEHGVLADLVTPGPPGSPPRQHLIDTRSGRRLALHYLTHEVTLADISPEGAADQPVRDEHGRPLRLIYGLAVPGRAGGSPGRDDLERARQVALEAYRRFLADESNAPVTGSASVALQCPEPPRLPESPRLPEPPGSGTLGAMVPPDRAVVPASAGHGDRRPRRYRRALTVGTGLLAAGAVAVLGLRALSAPDQADQEVTLAAVAQYRAQTGAGEVRAGNVSRWQHCALVDLGDDGSVVLLRDGQDWRLTRIAAQGRLRADDEAACRALASA